MTERQILDAPPAILDRLARMATARRRSEAPANVDLDTAAALRRAEQIIDATPGATKGSRGYATLKLAMQLRDAAVSEWAALDFLERLWAGKCEPPLALGSSEDDDQGLETIVANAYRFAQNAPGSGTAEARLAGVKITPPSYLRATDMTATAYQGVVRSIDDEPDFISPRPKVHGEILTRKTVSAVSAPGGFGKTTLGLHIALDVVTGRNLFAGPNGDDPRRKVYKPGPVFLFNGEDDREEMFRRLKAARIQHGITKEDTAGRLFMHSGAEESMRLAVVQDGEIVETPIVQEIIDDLKRIGAVAAIFDPLVTLHNTDENNNSAMNAVLRILLRIAIKANVAVLAVTHSKKGATAGDADSTRGASAQKDAVRSMYTVSPMAADEAKKLSVPEEDRFQYIRVDSAKYNLGPRIDKALWFQLTGVDLKNRTAEYPLGDSVQSLVRWDPPVGPAGMDPAVLRQIMVKIDAGPKSGERYLFAMQSDDWAGKVIMALAGFTEYQADIKLKSWKTEGLLEVEDYKSKKRGSKTTKGVAVDWLKVEDYLTGLGAPLPSAGED